MCNLVLPVVSRSISTSRNSVSTWTGTGTSGTNKFNSVGHAASMVHKSTILLLSFSQATVGVSGRVFYRSLKTIEGSTFSTFPNHSNLLVYEQNGRDRHFLYFTPITPHSTIVF